MSIEFGGVKSGEEVSYRRLEKIVADGRLPFEIEWFVKENGDTETLLHPSSEFSGLDDFVKTLSLGNSSIDGKLIVSNSIPNDEYQSEKTFGSSVSQKWRVDSERGVLFSSGSPLHQWMQPELIFSELPQYLVFGTSSIWNSKQDNILGKLTDEASGNAYSITSKVMMGIFMSENKPYYRKEIPKYFEEHFPKIKM